MDKRLFDECEKCLQDEPAPCSAYCPLHLDVAAVMAEAEKGDFKKAYKLLEKRIPFTGIVCMICDHPCEDVCVRKDAGSAISISDVEKAAVMYGRVPFKKSVFLPKANGRIAVAGGGLSGLTAAFELNKKGFGVTIFEQADRLGGRIWNYADQIPGGLIDEELQIISNLGVNVQYNKRVSKDSLEALFSDFGAVYLGTGAWAEQLSIDHVSLQTAEPRLFAGGRLCGDESVIFAVSSGKRAAASIERFIKGVSMTASREREGSFETPMKYSANGLEPSFRTEKSGGSYSKAEAAQEAARCMKCRCRECRNACAHLQKYDITPKSYGRQIYINENVIMGSRYSNKMINSCALCGLCKEQCPAGVGMAEIIHETRESMVLRSKMPPSAHDFALKDMEFSNSGRFFMLKQPPGKTGKNAGYIFYPGCQLAASSPEHVMDAYKYLMDNVREGAAVMLGCCGAPADWAGCRDLMLENAETFRRVWREAGNPAFILACSSCASVFERYMPEIPNISLWEVIDRFGAQNKKTPGLKTIAVHDACAARHDSAVQESVRSIASKLGYKITELNYSRENTKCCGYGGLVFYANREQEIAFADNRIGESEEDFLVYCAMCKDLFTERGKRAFHILDLVFGSDAENYALKAMPSLSERRANRSLLKRRLVKEIWGEDEDVSIADESRLIISPQVKRAMEDRLILTEDINDALSSPNGRFYNPEDDSYLASVRKKNVTYWVRYQEKENGALIQKVYSHRMNIEPQEQ
jgi:Fe-S oxidoreductase